MLAVLGGSPPTRFIGPVYYEPLTSNRWWPDDACAPTATCRLGPEAQAYYTLWVEIGPGNIPASPPQGGVTSNRLQVWGRIVTP